MPFHVCYYHFIWSTKHREPLLVGEVETLVYATIKRKSESLKSPILALNGTAEHIHVAVSLSLTVSVAVWVKQVKGTSAREVNVVFPDELSHFRWQSSYGVLTFGVKHLPYVITYIERQKEHHAHNTSEPYLEQTGQDD
jgi:putative transposase